MWPSHCVQGTRGAEFHPECPMLEGEILIDKGTLERVDSYSGFGTFTEQTPLLQELTKRGVSTIYCVGLAYDQCVGSTAEDGAKNGFKTYIIRDATRSVAKETEALMEKRLEAAQVIEIKSD